MFSDKTSRVYTLLIVLAIILGVVTFTPLIMPYGIHTPKLFSLPYTLWTGLIVALLFVLLTFFATRFHPGRKEDES